MKPQSSREPSAERRLTSAPPRANADATSTAATVLPSLRAGAWVAVVRLRSLGDIILTTPALAALKRWRPDLRVAYLAEPGWAAALERNPDVDAILPVPRGAAARLAAARRLRRLRPELAINWHGGTAAAALTWASGAGWRAGYEGQRHRWAVNLLAPPRPAPAGRRRWHTAEHAAALLQFLGLPVEALGPARIFPAPEAQAAVRCRLQAAGVCGPYVFLNVFPREATLRWPVEGYLQLAPWLRERFGLGAVMAHPLASPEAAERSIGKAIRASGGVMVAPASLEDLIALIAGAVMVIGSDGGPLHIAAALAKPVVALFGPTDRDAWAPWRTPLRLLAAPETAVPWAEVREAVEQLMGSGG